MATIAVDEGVLAEIVRRLVEEIHPQKIILFGSRARGEAHRQSDVDLLVVKPSPEPPHRRLAPAYRALLWGSRVAKPILR